MADLTITAPQVGTFGDQSWNFDPPYTSPRPRTDGPQITPLTSTPPLGLSSPVQFLPSLKFSSVPSLSLARTQPQFMDGELSQALIGSGVMLGLMLLTAGGFLAAVGFFVESAGGADASDPSAKKRDAVAFDLNLVKGGAVLSAKYKF